MSNSKRVAMAVLPGVVLAMAHGTILNLPHALVVDALNSDRYRFHWIIASYVTGSAIGMAVTRFVATRVGLRLTFVFSLCLFSFAGGWCATMDDVASMTPLRFLQGLGDGLLIVSAMVLLWKAFPQRLHLAMTLYGGGVYAAALAGPVLSGLIVSTTTWRWLFLVNVPLGLLWAVVAWRLLPRDHADTEPVHLDPLGLLLLVAWIVTANVVLDMGQYWGWTNSPSFVPWYVGWIVSFSLFMAWGFVAARPLINLRVLQQRAFALALGVKVCFSVNLYVLLLLLSAYMIQLRGYQWHQGGFVFAPAFLTMLAALGISWRLGPDWHRRARSMTGLCIMALATWWMAAVDLYASKFWLAGMLAVWGLGAGLVIVPVMTTMFEKLTLDQAFQSAGVFNIMRTLPALFIGLALTTQWTRTTDANFDNQRRVIAAERPTVAATLRHSADHFQNHGSSPRLAEAQAQALLGKWTHANARVFALQTILHYLGLITGVGILLIVALGPSTRAKEPSAPSPG